MKQVCRMDKTNNRPYCLRKPCSYFADGSCAGPVVAITNYYSRANCPDEPCSGGLPLCGQHPECAVAVPRGLQRLFVCEVHYVY